MFKSSLAASNLLKRASSSSPSTWRWSHSPATFSSQIRPSSSQISSPESEHVFKGYLTGFPKPGDGKFGTFYGSQALGGPKIDKLPYSVRSFHQSAIRFQDTVASTGAEYRSGSGSSRGGWAPKVLKNLNPFWHIEEGIKDILKDYVHHKMTLNWILVWFRLFLIIATKDVFLALIFP